MRHVFRCRSKKFSFFCLLSWWVCDIPWTAWKPRIGGKNLDVRFLRAFQGRFQSEFIMLALAGLSLGSSHWILESGHRLKYLPQNNWLPNLADRKECNVSYVSVYFSKLNQNQYKLDWLLTDLLDIIMIWYKS